MKIKLLFLAFFAMIAFGFTACLFYACTKSQNRIDDSAALLNKQSRTGESFTSELNEPIFNASVGAPIDGSLGRRWITNFANTASGGRLEYFILVRDLQKILYQENCVGICLYYAKNNRDELVVLPIGLTEKGILLKNEFIDTEDGPINWKTAQEWISKYKGEIKARFFGRNTFERLTKNSECKVIRVSYAIDDMGKDQLLLADAGISDPLVYEDASRPCPPYCPLNEN